ncbi:NrfD/PsrC family molybdoenzyme membrane anchor subunit [Shewanella sp. YIC-542]|uniref:NrfD/PsrC family molybdoenzyme membrane anchor subunit n=1 Tax=Shewanella mytili TaxID=3377111 RepID=UPI00398EFC24
MSEIHWGILVAAYLFFAGAGAGALFISGLLTVTGKIAEQGQLKLSRYSALAGTVMLIVGTAMIAFDLTTFQYGLSHMDVDKLIRAFRLFMTFQPSSMMSIGTWLLTFMIILSVLYCASFYLSKKAGKPNSALAVINMVLAVCVAAYTALLIGDISHNIVWSNSILVIIFLLSALSSGVGLVLIIRTAIRLGDEQHRFAKADTVLLVLELLALLIFAYSVRNVSLVNGFDNLLGLATAAGAFWWGGAVLLGLVLPLLINLVAIKGHLQLHCTVEYFIALLTLIGAFCLRYSVLLAGQYY